MKKRLISVFAFALAVSAGAAFVLYQLISTRVTAGASAHPVTHTVFVAAHDLDAGSLITDRDITTEEYLSVPAGAVIKKDDLLNRGVINPIHRDTPFFDGALAAPGAGAGFASIIPKGMRALAVRVNDVAGVAGFAIPGVHVDVLVAGLPPGPGHENAGAVSRTLLQNISILSAGQNYQKDAEGKPILVAVVNLLVTPAQAEILTLATDERIQLVLRNPTDQAIVTTTGADTGHLFDGAASAPVVVPPRPGGATAAPRPRPRPVVQPPTPPAAHPQTVEVLAGSTRTEVTLKR